MVLSHKKVSHVRSARSFTAEASEAAFLLGGIGTGNVSLGSRGEFRDWELFNHPDKGLHFPNSYFAIWAKEEGEPSIAKVLQSQFKPPHSKPHGYSPYAGGGLPRMEASRMSGEYPICRIVFEDSELPVQVELEAYTPFIPLNADDSGIPGAVMTYWVKNVSDRPVDVTVAGSLINPIGGISFNAFGSMELPATGRNVNDFVQKDGISGLYFHSHKYADTDLLYGDMSLVTTNPNVTSKRVWLRGAHFDYLQEFWDDFAEDGRLNDLGYETPSDDRKTDTGSLGIFETLAPGETKQFQFIMSWYFPNRMNGWSEQFRVRAEGREITQNYYATRFDSSWSAAAYIVQHFERLERETYLFQNALFNSTLPDYVLDAMSANITVLRSTTCFWLKNGKFFGFEGSLNHLGSCEGTCTHVWNYAQTAAFLFPTLERSMRQTEFLLEMHEDGKMNYRATKVFESEFVWPGNLIAPGAADGQMGAIMRVFREWKLSGEDEFVKELWPSVQKALHYGLEHWDTDGDYVMDGQQHNTYDIDFHGPNPLTGTIFLGALRAAEEIAAYLGEADKARAYRDIYEKSLIRLEELMWNGEYYEQMVEDVDQHKHQLGLGCLSDQLLGQQFAHLYGLGYLLPPDKVRSALSAVFKYNFRNNFNKHANCQRVYALNDEQGMLLCSWPQGGRPKLPFVYSDEVWTGIEYQVATHLIYEGFLEEGLKLVKTVRNRHDGIRRNPWNEVECGHHYVRSMASWGLLIALSGFKYDMVQGTMAFAPVIDADRFTSFWSTGKAWGTYSQRMNQAGDYEAEIKVLYGDMTGVRVIACGKDYIL
ncbi:GH116 family glycosyl-hydrolase [Paenibacillus sp. MAH-36]|uniref:GH116 family glycosyl-hydrolase n=1 Tax=Paenibacillus violae TaxID=3077234 RepID=A0ABU3RG74_9BACL|nr:GH116 family glycosyl-hydrolase [Paenibacillus sp. PFR10]MDU0203261.1 GH116 family glycosyl-hydrolase [Paenibacillus sp. PFR10]